MIYMWLDDASIVFTRSADLCKKPDYLASIATILGDEFSPIKCELCLVRHIAIIIKIEWLYRPRSIWGIFICLLNDQAGFHDGTQLIFFTNRVINGWNSVSLI